MPENPPSNPTPVPAPVSGARNPALTAHELSQRAAPVQQQLPQQQPRLNSQLPPNLQYAQTSIPQYGAVPQARQPAPPPPAQRGPIQPGYFPQPAYPQGMTPYPGNPSQPGPYALPHQFPVPFPYYPVPSASAQQQPVSNARQQQSYAPVPVPPPRQISTPVVAQRQRKAIPIVNPDTREVVQISKIEPTSTSQASSATANSSASRTSEPEPIPAKPSSAASASVEQAVVSEDKENTGNDADGAKAKDSVKIEADASAEKSELASVPFSAKNDSENDLKTVEEKSSPISESVCTADVPSQSSLTKKEEQVSSETQSSSTASKDHINNPRLEDGLPDETSKGSDTKNSGVNTETFSGVKDVHAASSVPETFDGPEKPSTQGASSNVQEVQAASPREVTSDEASEDLKNEVTRSEPTENQQNEEQVQSNPVKRERPISPKFAPGDRLKYEPSYISAMRPFASQEKAAEYDILLQRYNISKKQAGPSGSQRGDSGNSRTRRGGAGLMGDPRGRFSGPPNGNFSLSGTPGVAGPLSLGGAEYDRFDLSSARRTAPPDGRTGSSGSGRDGDPRGRVQMNARGSRFDGLNRRGPLDPIVPQPPVEKLKKTEKGWARNKEADDEVQSKVKQVRSLLNKLTLEKFDKIFKQIVDIDLSSVEILRGVVGEVFEKTLFEPKFSSMYAELCLRLDRSTETMLKKANFADSKGKPLTFRKILLKNCQDEFTRFSNSGVVGGDKSASPSSPSKDTQSSTTSEAMSEESEKQQDKDGDKADDSSAAEKTKAEMLAKEEAQLEATKAKRRMLANVQFIGELYLKDLLSETIIHKNCVQRLLALGIEKREEDVLEALCKLLSKTGGKLSTNPKATNFLEGYFNPLQKMAMDHTLPARIRFMLQDLIEQRANNWKARREEAGAKTISEIHRDIANEERAKADAQASRDRRGRGGGGGGHRDRGPPFSSAPRMTMTMGPPSSRQSGSGGISRSQAQLEKFSSRASGLSANMQSVRLGPGGTGSRGGGGANGWRSAGSGGVSASSRSAAQGVSSLRPSGNRNMFSALAENKDSGTSTSDVRRSGGTGKFGVSAKGPAPGSRPGSTGPSSAPSPPVVETMSLADVKKRAKSIVSEYWAIKDIGEARACVIEEVKAPNYTRFVEAAIRVSLEGKVDERNFSVPLFQGLIEEVIPASDFISGLRAVISDLDDIEVDDPRASEFVARYIGSLAGTGKLGRGQESGLDFIPSALENVSGKRLVKFIILTLKEYEQALSEKSDDSSSSRKRTLEVFKSFDVDVCAKIMQYNPMRGLSVLEDLLADNKMTHLVPMLPLHKKVKEFLDKEEKGDEMFSALQDMKIGNDVLKSEEFTRLVVRYSFDNLFHGGAENISEKFLATAGQLIKRCNGGNSPSEAVQMGVILEVQSFLHDAVANGTLGPEADKKHGHIAFECLYDCDIVEEDVFMAWKDDTGVSMKTAGKQELLLQTSSFFKWLAEADVE